MEELAGLKLLPSPPHLASTTSFTLKVLERTLLSHFPNQDRDSQNETSPFLPLHVAPKRHLGLKSPQGALGEPGIRPAAPRPLSARSQREREKDKSAFLLLLFSDNGMRQQSWLVAAGNVSGSSQNWFEQVM